MALCKKTNCIIQRKYFLLQFHCKNEIINNDNKKRKPINLIISRFQPFSNKHLNECYEAYAKNRLKVVLVQIISNECSKTPISKNTSTTVLNEVKNNEKIIGKYDEIASFKFFICNNTSNFLGPEITNIITEIVNNIGPIPVFSK